MDLIRYPSHGGNLLCRLGASSLAMLFPLPPQRLYTRLPPRLQRVCGAVELQVLSIRPARIRFPPLTYAEAYC
jgi:hypothetical protein